MRSFIAASPDESVELAKASSSARTSGRSAGSRELGIGRAGLDGEDPRARETLHQRGLVGAGEADRDGGLDRPLEHLAAEDLRRLGAEDPAAIHGSHDHPLFEQFERVRSAPPEHRPVRRQRRLTDGDEIREQRAPAERRRAPAPGRSPAAGDAASAAVTESCRLSPPETVQIRLSLSQSGGAAATSAGSATVTESTPAASRRSTVQARSGRPAIDSNCLERVPPKRRPRPAAGTTACTGVGGTRREESMSAGPVHVEPRTVHFRPS